MVLQLGKDALGAADLRVSAGGAFQHDDVDLFLAAAFLLKVVGQPAHHALAFLDEVSAERGGVLDVIHAGGDAVEQDQRDLSLVDLFEDLVPAGGHNAGEEDVVHALGDEAAQGLHLVLLLLLAVRVDERPALLLNGVADVVGVGGTPVGLLADLGEADGQREGAGGAQNQRQSQNQSNQFFHWNIPSVSIFERNPPVVSIVTAI